jgi:hypothetical protein
MTGLRFPWPTPTVDNTTKLDGAVEWAAPPRRRGRRPAAIEPPAADLAGWTHGRLLVSGPAKSLAAFRAAARGPGITPWQTDYDRIEEDAFHLALQVPSAERGLSTEGCRRLARQYREAVEVHHARAAACAEQARQICPLDLHALIPVPGPILALGPAHPQALAWCAGHWGVTALRRVSLLENPPIGRRLKLGHGKIGYDYWAMGGCDLNRAALAARWPDLSFHLNP